jgi:PucR family transcriptional regulator, purine catabolism regulatory protein
VATVVGIAIAKLYQRLEAERRAGADLFAELLGAALAQGDQARRLLEVGFEPMEDMVIVAINSDDPRFDDAEIHHRLRDRLIPSLLTARGELLVLVPDTPEALGALEGVDFNLTAGLSAPFRPAADWAVRRRQARWSLERAASAGRRVARFAEEDRAGVWLPPEEELLRDAVEHVLGPVLRYDDTRNTKLVDSLRTLFAHDRRTKIAAAELGIHQHTLAYRVQTVERLTGRRLRSLHDLVDLWLAMKALDVLRGGEFASDTRSRAPFRS